ncbi:PTS lactose/cellobiose transporter subunit IIA [Bacillus paralicheniformis]|nr:hypothetical protein EI977_20420 [Bacillus paralicheniformis]KAA0837436.1 hypothetical protein EI979_13160 [Bacillus paralicheniformis]MBU8583519.1 PTS lactose/cellobiose transporter subunit IIA [Bacillus paralicheniformis]MBZ5216625.1 PTS lactose/cellobiose transporter subunit IIA [Bacillus paralicheniformis]MCB6220047.1 PTS lactose/cellobiose transporter subunit IIA [Bacillus paralicheniformis]
MHEYQTGMIAADQAGKQMEQKLILIHKSDQLHDQNARRILYIIM